LKINNIELVNFRNHAQTRIDLDTINVFVGKNAAGKSSIKAAIEYALTGRCEPWTDGAGRGAEAMVRNGAAGAGVRLDIEGLGQVSRAIPNALQVADWQGNLKLQQEELYRQLNADADVTSALLNTSRFISMKPDEQKNMLFRLAGLKFDHATIQEALGKYLGGTGKADMMTAGFYAYLEQFLPASTAGGPEVVDAVYNKVFTERRAARKNLKDLETLAGGGSQQESGPPPGAWEARDQIKADLAKLKARKEELLKQHGRAKGRQDLINTLGDRVRRLAEQKEAAERELAEVQYDPAELEKLEKSLPEKKARAESARNNLELQRNLMSSYKASLDNWTAARDRLSGNHDWTCPMVPGLECAADRGAILKKVEADIDAVAKLLETAREESAILEGDLKKFNAHVGYTEERISELRRLADRAGQLTREIEECGRQMEAAKKELMEAEKAVFSTDEIEIEIQQLTQRIEKGENLVHAIAGEEIARKERARVTGALEKKRQEVAWLEALVEAFGPKGIKARMLERVIGPLQDLVKKRLEMLTAGRYTVTFNLEKGFEILVTAAGVTTALEQLSTSERMRVGIVLQDALNALTGLRLMVIDDCEILDPQNKQLLIGMLLQMKDDYDTIIVLSALGETAPRNPGIPGLSVYMVEDGSVRLIPAAQAA